MDKINEAALIKRVKTLVLQGKFQDALREIDEIGVEKIKNAPMLCLIAEVYIGLDRYDEAEHILLRLYEKEPTSRRILDLLTALYIDKSEYSEAEYYYKEFIGVASKDLHRYILRYRLDKGKGERLSVLISTLEKLKDYEYIEEWAYELARLYHEAGEDKKSTNECDEIVLWFGHGEYVDKAIALKCSITGEPLPEMSTVEMYQAEAERLAAEQSEEDALSADKNHLVNRIFGEDPDDAEAAFSKAAAEAEQSDDILADAPVMDTQTDMSLDENNIFENSIDVGMIDRALQEKRAEPAPETKPTKEDEKAHIAGLFHSLINKAVKHVPAATAEDTAEDSGMADMEAAVAEAAQAVQTAEAVQAAEAVRNAEAEQAAGTVRNAEAEQAAGTVRNAEAEQAAGTVRNAGAEQAAELVRNAEAEQAAGTVQDAEAVQSTGAAQASETAGETEEVQAAGVMKNAEATEPAQAADITEASAAPQKTAEELQTEALAAAKAEALLADMEAVISESEADFEADEDEDEDGDEMMTEPSDFDDTDTAVGEADFAADDSEAVEDIADEDEDEDDDEVLSDEVIGSEDADIFDKLLDIDIPFDSEEFGDALEEDAAVCMTSTEVPAAVEKQLEETESLRSDEDLDDEDEVIDGQHVSDTVLNIFGPVAGVASIQSQLEKTLTRLEDPALDSMDLLAPYDINFVVTGHDMTVKTQIAIGIAKALNTYGICDKTKLVRAQASELNTRDFSMIFSKLSGGCLIIEAADELSEQSAKTIVQYISKNNQDVAIVLEGEEAKLKDLFRTYRELRAKFLNIIHIGKYNENELVQLAKNYASKKKYDISAEAIPVLKLMLRDRMQEGGSVNYEDIMAIIEEAISSLEKRNMKNLFMTVLDNKYEEAGMFTLIPEDFDNINIG